MKCPTCGYITDPLHDLCSRCYADLREQKKLLGLPIADPDSDYKVLLAKKVRIIEGKKNYSGAQSKKNFFVSLFGRLSGRKKSATESQLSAAKNDQFPSDQAGTEALPSNEAVVAAVVEAQESKADAGSGKPRKLRLGKMQKQQMAGLLGRIESGRQAARRAEAEAAIADKNRDAPAKFEIPLKSLPEQDQRLWDNSFREIGVISEKSAKRTAIQVSSLVTKDSQAALAVYFDLAFEELSSPDRKRQFVREASERKVTVLESNELKRAFNVFSRSGLNKQETASDRVGEEALIYADKMPAGAGARMLSFVVDSSLAALLSALVAIVLFALESQEISGLMLGDSVWKTSTYLTMVLTAFPAFILFFLLLCPIIRVLEGQTPGESLAGIRLVYPGHKKLSVAKSIAWNLLSVFALLSLGAMELRGGSGLWRERMLGTRLLRS